MHRPVWLQRQKKSLQYNQLMTEVDTRKVDRGTYATIVCKSVVKMSLCTQDKKLEWRHAERKSVLLIPVCWETFVSLFSPAGPLGSPSVLRLTSDRAAPLSLSKPSGWVFDSRVTLPGGSREVLSSKHLGVTSAVWLGVGQKTRQAWLEHNSPFPSTRVTPRHPVQVHFQGI